MTKAKNRSPLVLDIVRCRYVYVRVTQHRLRGGQSVTRLDLLATDHEKFTAETTSAFAVKPSRLSDSDIRSKRGRLRYVHLSSFFILPFPRGTKKRDALSPQLISSLYSLRLHQLWRRSHYSI